MRKLLLSILAVVCVIFAGVAQNKMIHGTVTDASGNPIVGAAVVVTGTGTGVTTNSDGRFAVSAPANGTLDVSFLGYVTQRAAINNRTQVDVTLQEDTQTIDDIVVTGYGAQRKAAFTGAASIIGEEVLSKKSDANFVKALEGTVPGVQMSNSTGIPGMWGNVYVRGLGSINSGANPLYVIDGMPVNSDYDTMSDTNNNLDPMTAVNPADIESVTVLKDAAATAIYGSRASNGVIVITTKKGSQGSFKLNLDVKQGFTWVGNNNMKFADAFETMDLTAQAYVNTYGYDYNQIYDALCESYEWDGKSSYDWVDAIERKGYYQEYGVSAQGKAGSTGYYASMGYLNSKGAIIGSGIERFTGRVNVDSKFKCFTFGLNSSFSHTISDSFSQSTGGSFLTPHVSAVTQMDPFTPFYDEDGNYMYAGAAYNPLAVFDEQLGDIYRVWNTTTNINPYLQVDFGKGIYAKTSLGTNIMNQREYNYWSAIYNPQGGDYNGLGQQYNSQNLTITWTNVLGWNYTFDNRHDVSLMLGQEMQRRDYWYEYYSGYDFPLADAGKRDLSTVGTWTDSEYYKSEARLASYFLDAHYSYDNRYYVSGSFRRDGSSVFGSDNRWGNFWSVGAKWRLSGENFLKDNQTVTNAALRVSYGTVGNQDIGWYAARGLYSFGYNYNSAAGMIPGSIANPQLTWETSKKFDIGFDLSFIDRIHFTFDYYNEKTVDMLMAMPLSFTTGNSSIMQNIGSMRNSGIELAVNATVMHRGDFMWNAYANITYNQNEVIQLSNDNAIESTYTIVEVGRPYHTYYMKEWAGVDYETGRPMWYLNAEGDETTFNYNAAAKRYVGSSDPKVIGGFGTNIKYKGLDFNIDFNFRAGNKVYDNAARFTGLGMSLYTPLKDVVYNSWTEDNKGAKYPQYLLGDPYNSTATSSRFLYSGSFLRINNITLGYTLPQKWTRKALIDRVRFYISLDNLYTITADDFIGYNPETFASGVIAFQHPSTRTFTGGVQITF